MTLEQLKQYAEDIAGQWNGDDSGIQEDNANAALEILNAIKTIEKNLKYLSWPQVEVISNIYENTELLNGQNNESKTN